MKVSYLLLISLLIVGALLVPAVSAEEPAANETVIYDKTFTWSDTDVLCSYSDYGKGNGVFFSQSQIYITNLLSSLEPSQLMCQARASNLRITGSNPSGGWPVTFTSGGVVIGSGEFYYFQYYVGDTLYTQSVVEFLDVDWSGVVSGKIIMSAAPEGYGYTRYHYNGQATSSTPILNSATPGYAACFWDGSHGYSIDEDIKFYTSVSYDWVNRIRITDTGSENHITRIDLIRNEVPDSIHYSSL